MSNITFREICDNEFWDLNITWNTEIPDFTQCFQNIVLELIPCICFWLVAFINIWHTSKLVSRPPLPWTLLLSVKFGFSLVLTFICFIELFSCAYSIYSGNSVSDAHLCATCVKTVTFIFIMLMMLKHKKSGITTSSILSIFWLVLSICGVIMYRSSFVKLYYKNILLTSELKFILDMFYYPLIFSQFILSLCDDTKDYRKVKDAVLFDELPFFSFLTFHWFNRFIFKSAKRLLTVQDFPPVIPKLQCRYTWKKFDAVWRKKAKITTNEKDDSLSPDIEVKYLTVPSLLLTLIKSFWPWFLIATILELILDVMRFFPILILDLLIEFSSNNEYMWRGYFYCILMFLSATTEKFISTMVLHYSMSTALQFRSALSSAVYRKALKLSSDTRRQYTLGELVSLMAVDVDKVFSLFEFFTSMFGAPLKIIITIFFLWQYLGPSCLAGVVVIIIVLPISVYVMRINDSVQEKQMLTKDVRLKHMNEILNGIKVLKLCAWEIPFMKNIQNIREKEVRLIQIFQFCYAVFSLIWCCSPFFVASASFGTYLLVNEDNILDPGTAFVSLSLLNFMRFALFEVPDILSGVVQTNIALRRLRKFLTSEERSQSAVGKSPDKGNAISFREASFSWEAKAEPVLKKIDLQIPVGSLVAIVGSVGSGKSSLLSAMLGDMPKLNGTVDLMGSLAYVPQQAWILNETVKQNILFIKPFAEKKYQSVISNCCLKPDLQLLPGGDLTEIGEKGVTLSGGQKQRISLARAVYQNADVYLLDDPLSAVDAHVGKHLFEHVIGSKGTLRKKTRVLVTHSIAVLPEVDFIVTMKDGEIGEVGSYDQLMGKDGPFASFIREHQQSREDSDEITSETESKPFEFVRTMSLMQRSVSNQSLSAVTRVKPVDPTSKNDITRLTEEEKMEIGKVKRTVYVNYLKHANWKFICGSVLGYLVFQVFEVTSNIWLSEWSSDPLLPDGTQDIGLRNLRIGVYAALGVGQAFAILLGTVMLAFAAARASKTYHHRMLESVMRSPMSFFDTTPLGRIINRFGKDVNVVDTEIPAEIDGLITCSQAALATCVVIGMNTPPFLAALIPLAGLFYVIQNAYLTTSRQIKRLESTSRSPMFSQFSETMQGVSSIRAYCADEHFINCFEEKIDTNTICYFYWNCCNRWLGTRLDILGNVVVSLTALLSVVSRGTLDAAIVGLILTYALQVADVFIWLVRCGTEIENQLVSVERIEEYSSLPSESPWIIPNKRPSPDWPIKGKIAFQNYSTRYRDNLDLVLKSINLDITPNEKVGIVGRTGAGKSSITLALFRIIEAVEGQVIIDDVDVSEIGLHDLRSKLTIIPQDPVLFTGTLRTNLDPNDDHSDDQLWTSLEHAHLKDFVASLSEGLNFEVMEGGENLSVGQRQLVCLARALLKTTKILVLDEATAAVDMETDSLIQNTIRQEFADYTVITIAHRLHTIMDYDKVVVMDAGQIVEVGKPTDLLQSPNSSFFSLAKNAGLT